MILKLNIKLNKILSIIDLTKIKLKKSQSLIKKIRKKVRNNIEYNKNIILLQNEELNFSSMNNLYWTNKYSLYWIYHDDLSLK